MSIKINGTVVFASNTAVSGVYLENVASVDANTAAAIVQSVKVQNHFFTLQNSAGTSAGTWYGANNDPNTGGQ